MEMEMGDQCFATDDMQWKSPSGAMPGFFLLSLGCYSCFIVVSVVNNRNGVIEFIKCFNC